MVHGNVEYMAEKKLLKKVYGPVTEQGVWKI
jgi:hypothetical protein